MERRREANCWWSEGLSWGRRPNEGGNRGERGGGTEELGDWGLGEGLGKEY